MEIIEHFGVHLRVDPDFMSPKLMEVVREGRYETPEARWIGKLLESGEVVLEIGAGIGFMTALMLKDDRVRQVVSYEANPLLIDKIRRTINDNGLGETQFELRNAILRNGDAGGSVDFHIHRDFWASSLRKTSGTIRSCPVPVESFDDAVRRIRPTLIVCDIEGGEKALFASADLTGVRGVYLELHQRVLGRNGMRDVFQSFHDRGFHYDQTHSQGAVVFFSRVDRPL